MKLFLREAFLGCSVTLGGLWFILGNPVQLHAYGPCDKDSEVLCAAKTHKETVQNCLHRLKAKTSSPCQAFLASEEPAWQKLTQSWVKVRESCTKELGIHCVEAAKEAASTGDKKFANMKDLQVCLMVARAELGAPCKVEINRHIKEFQPHIQPLEE